MCLACFKRAACWKFGGATNLKGKLRRAVEGIEGSRTGL
jgi:hypothetical protein